MSASIEKLIAGLNPKAKMPKAFPFYSEAMQIAWLKSHQLVARATGGAV